MLSTTAPTAPPSSTLLLHHRRRRGYLDSHLPSSTRTARQLPSQLSQPRSLCSSSPPRFDRSVSWSRRPANSSTMADYRHVRSGSLNIPSQSGPGAAGPAPGQPHGRFDGPRSPPSMALLSYSLL